MKLRRDRTLYPLLLIGFVLFLFSIFRTEESKYLTHTTNEVRSICTSKHVILSEIESCIQEKDPNIKSRFK